MASWLTHRDDRGEEGLICGHRVFAAESGNRIDQGQASAPTGKPVWGEVGATVAGEAHRAGWRGAQLAQHGVVRTCASKELCLQRYGCT